MRRVVVTGMGAVTPIGIGVDTFWENVKKKTLGFGEITRFDTTDYKVHIAAEVKDFAGKDYMDFKAAKRMELFCQYAVAAAKEAFEQEDKIITGYGFESKQQKRRVNRRDWIWKKKIRFAWDVPSDRESEVCRQQRRHVIKLRRKDLPE